MAVSPNSTNTTLENIQTKQGSMYLLLNRIRLSLAGPYYIAFLLVHHAAWPRLVVCFGYPTLAAAPEHATCNTNKNPSRPSEPFTPRYLAHCDRQCGICHQLINSSTEQMSTWGGITRGGGGFSYKNLKVSYRFSHARSTRFNRLLRLLST